MTGRQYRPENLHDPDVMNALAALDSEFPGALYDRSLRKFVSQKHSAGRRKKWLITAAAKFVCFAGCCCWFTAGTFPLDLLDYLTIAAAAAVFAVLPSFEYATKLKEKVVKGQGGCG